MAKCSKCNYKWSWKEVMAVGFSNKGKICPYCHTKQYISLDTQKWLTLGFLSLVFIAIFPFLIKLSDKDEKLY